MADDQTKRPYRSNEPAITSASGSDPLAELARLIGQNDPLGEFGRENVRRAAAALSPVAAPPLAPKFGANDYFGGFEPDSYPQTNAELAGEEGDFYEDVPPTKRRSIIMAIAAVIALAVIATAGAFGYRTLFGPTSSSTPPPVTKADTAPSKIVPAASTTPNKLFSDRVPDHAQAEEIVSREEQPVDNQSIAATSTAPTAAPVKQAPPLAASNPPAAANPQPQPPPAPRQAETRAAAQAPTRTASVAGAAAKTPHPAGSYVVQVASQRSEAGAQAAFRNLQAKYAGQLGGRHALIHKVELGAKGTYYRAIVGPFTSANEANELCSGLKAVGGHCIVQRN
jgi:cell division septation protein DedD